MINSQEIIERSIYQALLNASIKLGYSLDPNNYLPISIENQKRFKEDMDKLNAKKLTEIYKEISLSPQQLNTLCDQLFKKK